MERLQSVSFGARFRAMRRRWIGVLVCLILLTCLVSPFVEMAAHSNGSILDGQDNESTVAIVALCVALALAAASLVWIGCVAAADEILLTRNVFRLNFTASVLVTVSGASPPLTLRI